MTTQPRRPQIGPPPRRPSRAGFTMVEIAIAIAVVAFALVAIIGVLPTGFQVQKQNREETLINQEGSLWVEAIRSGARGMHYLTNHVDLIQRTLHDGTTTRTNTFRYGAGFSSGLDIVGLLTQPKYRQLEDGTWTLARSRALVRAVTGSAADKTPANEFAFTYLLTIEAVPFTPFAPAHTNFTAAGLTQTEALVRSNNFQIARNFELNTHSLRLTLDWPAELHPRLGLRTGRNRKTFRVLANGWLQPDQIAGHEVFWKRPAEFRLAP